MINENTGITTRYFGHTTREEKQNKNEKQRLKVTLAAGRKHQIHMNKMQNKERRSFKIKKLPPKKYSIYNAIIKNNRNTRWKCHRESISILQYIRKIKVLGR